MKGSWVTISLLIFFQLTAFEGFGQGCKHRNRDACKVYHTLDAEAIANRPYHVLKYDLHLYPDMRMDPDVPDLEGQVTISFIALDSLKVVELDLSQRMSVTSITDTEGNPLLYSHEDDILSIELAVFIAPGDSSVISIDYEGNPYQGNNSFRLGVAGGDTILWTLSEPFGGKDWWPARHDLGDKADSTTFTISIPIHSNLHPVANGRYLGSSVSSDGDYVEHRYAHGYPIATYLVAFAVADYAQFDTTYIGEFGSFPIVDYAYRRSARLADSLQVQTLDQMALFEKLFGPYPFSREHYGHAQFSRGGGMEHQTMSFVVNWNFDLIAHELAHQWYGDKITCASWSHIWSNEGFASYSELLAFEFLRTRTEWRNWLGQTRANALSAADGSVYVADTTSVPRIFDPARSYEKGAMLLHMLRNLIGDTAFFVGLKAYTSDPTLSYRFAEAADFQRHLEVAADTSLTQFFSEWYYGEGHPIYAVEARPQGNAIQLTIRQRGSAGQLFDMPLEIRLHGREDSLTIQVRPNGSFNSYTLSLPFDLVKMTVDPDWKVLAEYSSMVIHVEEGNLFNARYDQGTALLTIETAPNSGEMNFGFHDLNGRMISAFRGDRSGVTHHQTSPDIASGVYVLTGTGPQGTQSVRIVIHNR